MSTTARVPVTIISGFLGSGKTSLLNHLLETNHGRRIAVLVNDFGAVNIDADLVKARDGEVVSLENGCVCCSLSEGLLVAVMRAVRLDPAPEHIVVETSGVADPFEVARTFGDPELHGCAPLDAIVTLADAQQHEALRDEALALARRQIEAADIVILNKTDLASPEAVESAREDIRKLNPKARITTAVRGRVDADALLGFGGSAAEVPALHGHGHDHAHEQPFESHLFEAERPLTMEALRAMLKALPRTVWRVKGFVHLAERPENRLILQATPRQAEMQIDEPWGEQAPATRIVLIGERGAVDWEATLAPLRGASRS